MTRLVFALFLSVSGLLAESHAADPVGMPADPFDQLQSVVNARSHEHELQIAAREQQFVDSFNRLAAALEDFSKTYKATHAIDVRQVKSIREAYRKLQQSDAWFRAE